MIGGATPSPSDAVAAAEALALDAAIGATPSPSDAVAAAEALALDAALGARVAATDGNESDEEAKMN